MERKGIVASGNWLLDYVNFVPVYPTPGNLVSVTRLEKGFGGSAHNVVADLAGMKSGIPLYACGCIGNDAPGNDLMERMKELNVDTSAMTRTDLPTSYTQVIAEQANATRTFFHNRGANALLDVDDLLSVDVPARIFHLGYLLLLDRLDEDDAAYGTRAARALAGLREKGYKTSVDVVSEEGDRFRHIVLPALPYIDYFIVNEVEAGKCVGEDLRDKDGKILLDKVENAARTLMEKGVKEVCAIHFPEGGFGMTTSGETCYVPSILLPTNEIVSTVGAGDAFIAGVLYALHEHLNLKECLQVGAASANFNLKSATCTGGAPTIGEIQDFIKNNYNN